MTRTSPRIVGRAATAPLRVPDGDEPFPFGKYAGVRFSTMLSVKSSYLRWLAEESWITKWEDVYAFIDANREALDLL